MTLDTSGSKRREIPAPQDNYARAVRMAFANLTDQSLDQLRWLGAEPLTGGCRIAVLDEQFTIDVDQQRISTSTGRLVGPVWSVLALHYLGVRPRPEQQVPEIAFADLADARTYAGVYQGRVVRRLCAKTGRDAQTLAEACRAVGGRAVAGGDLAYEFSMFPRLTIRLVWHAPDEEFPPSATFLLPANIGEYFCTEDIVVLSEALVSRLGGTGY